MSSVTKVASRKENFFVRSPNGLPRVIFTPNQSMRRHPGAAIPDILDRLNQHDGAAQEKNSTNSSADCSASCRPSFMR